MQQFELNTEKRIRLGIWGLGRGMSFYKSCEALGIDVVAGCDYNEHMRDNFLESCPGAFVTADSEEFLKYDMDAVLVAAELVLESGVVSAQHVLNVLGRLSASIQPEAVETTLTLNEAPLADTGRYDRLRAQDSVEGVDHA